MNRSSWAVDGASQASIKTSKQEDGSYKAEAIGQLGKVVQPTVAANESTAVNLLTQSIQKAQAEGKL